LKNSEFRVEKGELGMARKSKESNLPWMIYVFTMIILIINQINWFGKGLNPIPSDSNFSIMFHMLFVFCSVLVVFIGIIALLSISQSED
jgi:hypothetical protein